MNPPLAPFQIAATDDVERARSVLSRELNELRIKSIGSRRSFRLDMNGVHLGKTTLAYNEFGTRTLVNAGEMENAVVLIVGSGIPSMVRVDREMVVCRDHAAVASPARHVKLDRPAGGGVYLLRAGAKALEDRLRELLGRRPGRPLVFERSVDLRHGAGAQVRQLMQSLAADLDKGPDMVTNPLLRAGFDGLLINALLALPNSFSGELAYGHVRTTTPAMIRRAEEFMEANTGEPVSVSDLVALCGCSERSLFKAFREHRGYTPMQFLSDCRLEAARTALETAEAGDSVTFIAQRCGCVHLGRFSVAYRKRFGESPSETLRRHR